MIKKRLRPIADPSLDCWPRRWRKESGETARRLRRSQHWRHWAIAHGDCPLCPMASRYGKDRTYHYAWNNRSLFS